MCGRAANGLTLDEYQASVRDLLDTELDVDPVLCGNEGGGEPEGFGRNGSSRGQYRSTYNVAPQTFNPVVRNAELLPKERTRDSQYQGLHSHRAARTSATHARARMQPMKWGLIPGFAKALPTGVDAYRTINARDDTVLSGQSMWTNLLPQQRCVFFVQGFYEWMKPRDGSRIAHFVGMANEGRGRLDSQGKGHQLMPLAGLWEKSHLKEPREEEVYSFTILTTCSNKQLEFLHDRMPVILPDAHAIRVWLGLDVGSDGGSGKGVTDQVVKLVKPYESPLDCYRCPTEVGKVGNSNPDFILPVSYRKDGIMAAFGKQKQKQEQKMEESKGVEAKLAAVGKGDGGHDDDVSTNSETTGSIPEPTTRSDGSGTAKKRKADDAADETKPRTSKAEPALKGQQSPSPHESSSLFSPDPYPPSVSPPRPHGGYSRERAEGSSAEKVEQQGSKSIKKALRVQAAKGSPTSKKLTSRTKGHDVTSSKGKTHRTPSKESPKGGKNAMASSSAKVGADIRAFFSKR
ncbi:DUF159-domain-containing protein [Tilletiaria anomala UBC 951]|uniref:DUF159-domain-containing protein n=1 Tax=Tilletiaria anomala (strain ATCC 24038 / CBS 436.72 / UBC 951) TaxID=1037660 RepID=A0A066WL82_TILAU|nr:DUF159-domain-containing protein [Tilletiaria anomala UBC 951]KDN51365.1 DUF159-domain-containing protein [Tilletiaria anomala UBC 951]